jgi:1-deoxy-D-xylulose-5-phosphate synthase
MRCLPNMMVMAPGDAWDVGPMLEFALRQSGPVSIRYPKANAVDIGEIARQPVELGRAEVLRWGEDGMILCFGSLLSDCLKAADLLAADGLEVGVVNVRFAKPLDATLIEREWQRQPVLFTLEDHAAACGFGSAVAELGMTRLRGRVDLRRLCLLGIPDRFIELTDVPGVKPARYRGRYHWVTIVQVPRFPASYLTELVEWSYQRAYSSLSKAKQIAIRDAGSLDK